MFRTLMTTGPQKRGVFRSFTKAAEPVCCTSAYTAERVNKVLLECAKDQKGDMYFIKQTNYISFTDNI